MSIRFLLGGIVGLSLALWRPVSGAPPSVNDDGLQRLPEDTLPVHYRMSVTPDLEWRRFTATAELTFEVLRPTARVVVNALELDIDSARLPGGALARIIADEPRQRVIFEFPHRLEPGRHRIVTTYSGKINERVSGLFRVGTGPRGADVAQQMLFTSLCCIATPRRLLPLWDQPDLKAQFEISLVIPKGLDAVSNMPITAREPAGDERVRIQFAPTPRMSSYLLFFAVGDFERRTLRLGPTELGMLMRRSKGEAGNFALGATAQTLAFYNDYFELAYPLPKLDSIGMPGVGAYGGMENWGAIVYFEPLIALDPARTSLRDQQIAYQLVAHEVAHQWFGNLVTLRWWDDLWMNEGFASWMAAKVSDRLHPEWGMWAQAAASRESAMRLDAARTAHPVVREFKTLAQAAVAFDEITYDKGAQLVRMIENWIGEQVFRDAIRTHIRTHAYGNASTADLLETLDRVSRTPVSLLVRDFTEQAGVPLIEVLKTRCINGRMSAVTLRQGRFGLDRDSRAPRIWRVPVTAGVAGSHAVTRQIVSGTALDRMDVPGCGAVKLNWGETGYFRVKYDPESFAALRTAFFGLSLDDQLGLLRDNRALAEAELAPYRNYFDIADSLPTSSDPLLLVDYITTVRNLLAPAEASAPFGELRRFAQSRFSPVLEQIGWTADAQEPANTPLLRDALIGLLARTGHRQTLAEASRRLQGAQEHPELLPGSLYKTVIDAVGAGADDAVFDAFSSHAAATTDPQEKTLYLLALAGANDPAISRRILDLALSEAVPEQIFPMVLKAVSQRHAAQAMDFVLRHYEQIAALKHLDAPMLATSVAGSVANPVQLRRFHAFMDAHSTGGSRVLNERAEILSSQESELQPRGLSQMRGWLDNRAGGSH